MRFGSTIVACLLVTSVARAQDDRHECHVYVVDVAAAIAAFSENRAPEAEEDTTLGRFQPVIDLNRETTKSFPWPGKDRVISAAVLYTERSLPLSKYAMTLAIVVAKDAVPDALTQDGAALARVSLEPDTFIVDVRQRLLLDGKAWVAGMQCQIMSDEERKRRLQEQQEQ